MSDCQAASLSTQTPGHLHTCAGHVAGDDAHFCRKCGLWWWTE